MFDWDIFQRCCTGDKIDDRFVDVGDPMLEEHSSIWALYATHSTQEEASCSVVYEEAQAETMQPCWSRGESSPKPCWSQGDVDENVIAEFDLYSAREGSKAHAELTRVNIIPDLGVEEDVHAAIEPTNSVYSLASFASHQDFKFRRFAAILDKKPARGEKFCQLGVQLAKRDIGLAIVSFNCPGELVREWNRKHPKYRLQQGDVITSVNGITAPAEGVSAMLNEIADAQHLKLHVLRATQYRIQVDKNGMLGLDVNRFDGTVIGMAKGVIQDYNSNCKAQFMVAHGDTLIEVNGKRGTPAELLSEITNANGALDLAFRRLHP